MAKTIENNLEENIEKNKRRITPTRSELLMFGAGSIIGMMDGLINFDYPTSINYYAKGLPFSLTAFFVNYYSYNNLKHSVMLGAKCQISYLFGRTMVDVIKNTLL